MSTKNGSKRGKSTKRAASDSRRRRLLRSSEAQLVAVPGGAYAADVLDGRIVACVKTVQACDRFLRDLQTADERGLYFDVELAQHALDFFPQCRLFKGKRAGRPFYLEPWQEFFVAQLFGWLRWSEDDGEWIRRFVEFYLQVARKNGKSTLGGGIANYGTFFTGERGAEGYIAANKEDQARIVFDIAAALIRSLSRDVRGDLRTYLKNISSAGLGSKLQPIGSDSTTQDGLDLSFGLIDELHEAKDRRLYDVLNSSMGARLQPILGVITTAGSYRPDSICYQRYSYSSKVLAGLIDDLTFLALVYELDEGDDFRDESLWIKASPNLGVSVRIEDMRRQLKVALEDVAQLIDFRRKRLNEWVGADKAAIDPEQWKRCGGVLPNLEGRQCFAALDLGERQAFSTCAYFFPDPDPVRAEHAVLMQWWLPEARLRKAKNREQLQAWVDAGLLRVTPGAVVDHRRIARDIAAECRRRRVLRLLYDPFAAGEVRQFLTEDAGVPAVEFRQNYPNYNTPTRKVLSMIASGSFRHGDDPILALHASGLSLKENSLQYVMPNRHSATPNDGMVASIMSVDAWLRVTQGRRVLGFDERLVQWSDDDPEFPRELLRSGVGLGGIHYGTGPIRSAFVFGLVDWRESGDLPRLWIGPTTLLETNNAEKMAAELEQVCQAWGNQWQIWAPPQGTHDSDTWRGYLSDWRVPVAMLPPEDARDYREREDLDLMQTALDQGLIRIHREHGRALLEALSSWQWAVTEDAVADHLGRGVTPKRDDWGRFGQALRYAVVGLYRHLMPSREGSSPAMMQEGIPGGTQSLGGQIAGLFESGGDWR